ncbi:Glutathione transport system permease protein GsiD [Corynebacterium kalinowskii]|uniref:Glutathione transport system permease protein GsiD n=1 Tax=Corynebacterium kalinowskii TaxID=2675216 RepID=A0A6B8VBN0_9CORY|nr:ABC transporter permease [Corynebacterium kalinowskii]QGU01573.1 Glutathione transport system permease protein GsiD [Corynebacterium kalinowskii]
MKLNLSGKIGLVIVSSVVLAALVSFFWTPYDPIHAMPADRLQGSSLKHLMGTDRYGRDVFSQMMAGSQIALLVGVVATGIGAAIGTPLGIISGMTRGWVDSVVMRMSDVLLAFPALLLAIITGAIWGSSTVTAMAAIGVASIPAFTRITRTGTIQVMSKDFILAARDASVPSWLIALRHVLPNIAGMLIVQASVSFALAILAEAALSFLGLGTPPPDPSWGRLLQNAQSSLASAPMLAVWPGATIAVTVLGFNLLGDSLRDLLDPKSRRSVKVESL